MIYVVGYVLCGCFTLGWAAYREGTECVRHSLLFVAMLAVALWPLLLPLVIAEALRARRKGANA